MSSDEIDTRTRILEATWKLLEENRGQGASMGAIAKAAGISRQAVYLHFDSRTDLMIATMNYVDEIKGLNDRLAQLQTARTGEDSLELLVDIWGGYIPEIFGLAKAMMMTRDTDEDMAAAWNNVMGCLKDVCRQTIEQLEREDRLAREWSLDEATEMFWTIISISNWEQLTAECGWTTSQYVERMKMTLKRSFVK